MNRCVICEIDFTIYSELILHIRLCHPNQNAYKCGCSMEFHSIELLKKHLIRHHSSTSESSSISLQASNSPAVVCHSNVPSSESEHLPTQNTFQVSSAAPPEFTDAAKCIANLYAYPDLPRKHVPELANMFTSLFNKQIDPLKTDLLAHLRQLGDSPENISKFESSFDTQLNPFQGLSSEHLAFKYFEKSGTLIRPQSVVVGTGREYKLENGVNVYVPIEYKIELIPLRDVFKRFFEIPNLLEETLNHMNTLMEESETVSNFIQGEYWKNFLSSPKARDADGVFIPLMVYFDDYEVNNPLGSHAGVSKVGAVYCQILSLPIQYLSKLENFFIIALFNTLDRSNLGNGVIFSKIIEELKFLENFGIIVEQPGKPSVRLYFKVALIVGDNLGLHSIFGFSESFSANYFCRFCLTEKKCINLITHERECVLRTPENYKISVETNNVSETGVKEECVFHQLPNFHVTDNVSVDCMHDLLEGICKYDLGNVLNQYVNVSKIFTLDVLNDRIRGFNWPRNEKQSKPSTIHTNHLSNKFLSSGSSSEMSCLCRNLPLLIGDLVPIENEYWPLVLKLKTIIDIVYSKSFHKSMSDYLDCLITEYIQLLLKLFPGCLKPKHHFLLHYPRVMKKMGPLSNISSMRFESKHRESKRTASVTTLRVNIVHTLALKHQLLMNHRFINQKSYPLYTCGQDAPECLNQDSEFRSVSYVTINGKDVDCISTILVEIDLLCDLKFLLVEKILIMKKDLNDVSFVCRSLTCDYDSHYDSYHVVNQSPSYEEKILLTDLIERFLITYHVRLSNNETYIAKKWP